MAPAEPSGLPHGPAPGESQGSAPPGSCREGQPRTLTGRTADLAVPPGLGARFSDARSIFIDTYFSVYVLIYASQYICIYLCISKNVFISVYIFIYVLQYACIYVLQYVCIYMCKLHVHIHAYTHTCICVPATQPNINMPRQPSTSVGFGPSCAVFRTHPCYEAEQPWMVQTSSGSTGPPDLLSYHQKITSPLSLSLAPGHVPAASAALLDQRAGPSPSRAAKGQERNPERKEPKPREGDQ